MVAALQFAETGSTIAPQGRHVTDFERLLTVLTHAKVEFIVIGGFAATAHGSAHVTVDLDVVYRRTADNVTRLVEALAPLEPYLRGAPPGLPFRSDVETIHQGSHFTPRLRGSTTINSPTLHHAHRNTSAGATAAALRAGMIAASNPTARVPTTMAMTEAGSVASTP